MSRAKRGFKRRRRVKKVLDKAEGYFLRRKNTFRRANEAVEQAGQDAYIGRRLRKREFRRLWITRINAAVRLSDMSYSRFMAALKREAVGVDRKQLSEMAIHDPQGFAALVDKVRASAPQN